MAHEGAPLTIRLLGPLQVAVHGRPIVVDTRKALAIVALVAGEGRAFARDEIAAMFWPEADGDAARGALRRTLSALRAALGQTGLIIDRAQVSLDTATTRVDLATLEQLADSSRASDLEAAAALARGPFLAGFALRDSPAFDDWQASRAARVEQTIGSVLERLATARLAIGDVNGAVEAARRRVDLNPLHEVGQRRLIELLARTGDRAGSVQAYRQLVALFDRELGVAPLRETTELYEAIREDRLPVVAPPTKRLIAAAMPSTPLIPIAGRERELAAIHAAWRGSTRDGRIVLIEGEAGIGKTRLGETIAGQIRAEGGIVLAARGYPGEETIAYGPIAELIRVGLATPDGARRLASLDDTARLEIGRLVDLPPPLRVAGIAGPDGAGARVRLLDAITAALAALGTDHAPGLIWIDDVHLVDDPTLEAIGYLTHRLAGRPLLLLLAWRREDLRPTGEAATREIARQQHATSLALRRLDRDDVAAIVRATRRDGADDALIDAFAADSEGLPLHLVEALTSGEAPGGATPRGVQSLLLERIDSVSETAGQVLSAAAVIGREFDVVTLRLASARSDEETVAAIEELTRRGIVRELPAARRPGRYDFAHRRMRDVAYESMSLARRRLLHGRTADALRLDTAPGQDDLTRFALIAGHEREAGRPAEAARDFLEAADRAEAVFANREAISHLESAVALAPNVAAAAHMRIGELRARLGEYHAAIASLETAAALASPADVPAIEIALGRAHQRRGDLDGAASHLAAALASPDLTDGLRARAHVERAVVALRAGNLRAAAIAAAEASEAATLLGDRHLAGLAQRLVGLVAHVGGDLVAARAALEESVALAADDPEPTASIAALVGLAMALAASGSIDEGAATADRALAACRRIGDRHLEAAVENHLADMLHDAGRTEASMAHLKRAVALFAEIGARAPQREPGIWTLAAW